MNATEAAKHIRGEPGTKVTLLVARKTKGGTERMELTRKEIRIPTVKGTGFADEGSKIGYVRLLQFQEDSFEKLKASIDRLQGQGMRALIVDLRFNGGGLLREAEEIADLFLEEGVIVETKGRLDEANDLVKAKKDGTYPGFPVALLVNSSSASASEVLAGALQDHERAILVGGRTYGKGSVQRYLTEELGDGSGFKYTWARYYTPKGRWIDKKAGKEFGLEPDLLVEQDEVKLMEHWQKLDKSEKSDFRDEPLERAVDALKVALKFAKK
jgi:carboxyl-terminal processing protease